jgi:glycerol-3-phosphate dehydrogenase
MYDAVIIGAGVVGLSVARELSKYRLHLCVLEKEADIAMGTTKANSAIVHAGFDAKPGTLKAKLNALGNSMFDRQSRELDFHFRRNGSLVLCFSENDISKLEELLSQGIENGVPGLKILSKEQVKEMEPNLSDDIAAALYAPTGGIVCPYEMAIALGENAYENGIQFYFDHKVLSIEKSGDSYRITTPQGAFDARMVINAAGLHADDLNNAVSQQHFHIMPRKGEYCLFDKEKGSYVSNTVFQLPTRLGKGVLVTPTVDGNLLIGPNAVSIEDKADLATTREGLEEILSKAALSIKEVPYSSVIASFSGLRAGADRSDFIIGEAEGCKGFINVAGIESPGLSCAPAIGAMVAGMVVEALQPQENTDFHPIRQGVPRFREMSNSERQGLIMHNPSYGKIICRCEMVTEGEILNAIRRPLGATTLDGIKRRTRAGMGRCQSGFCMTRVLDILSKELHIPPTEVTKFGGESRLLVGKNKEDI